jgi:ubiquinol-cytochrome c reductase cytochrome b subunit
VSRAYASAIDLSFNVRAGLLMRQMHHWAALLFVWAIVTHLCRIFFTGAFRRPREINWIIGVTMLALVLMNDFLGYSLLDDLLSGTGVRIAYGIVESVPVVGTWGAALIFGGPFPGHVILGRMFIAHVLVVPLLIFALLGLHLSILWRQKHTQFPGPGRRDDNVVGSHLWPEYAAKSVGLFAIVAGVVALLGALVQINPVWLYGPYEPAASTTYAQPDFVLGWVEGAMRLFPGWEITIAHQYRIAAPFWPAVFFPMVTFLVLYSWPFVEKRLTGDRAEHNVIERPRDRPLRSAFGLAVLTFYSVLLLAGSQDIIAAEMNTTIVPVVRALRIAVIALPVLVGVASWKILHDLQRSHEQPLMVEEPNAPNELPPALAPSPNRPMPHLLTEPDGAGEPAADRERADVVGKVAAAAVEVGIVVSEVVDAGRKHRRRRRARGRPGS